MKLWASIAVALCLSAGNAYATTIISVVEPTFFEIGADSKVIVPGSPDIHPSLICKIHRAGRFYWASAGMVTDTSGQFDLDAIVRKALSTRNPMPRTIELIEERVSPWVELLLNNVARARPDVYLEYYEGNATPTIVIASFEGSKPYLELIEFWASPDPVTGYIKAKPQTARVPQDGGARGRIFTGVHEEISRMAKADPMIDAQIAKPETIARLINIEIAAHPRDVGGKIAIVAVDRSGAHWIQNGECRH